MSTSDDAKPELASLDRRHLLAYAAATAVTGSVLAVRPDSARAVVNLGETTSSVKSVSEALAAAQVSAWGGFSNGRIPAEVLTTVSATVAGSGFLRDDAARQFLSMSLAFRQALGRSLTITEGYRDFARQVDYWNRYQAGTGNLAAYPGTSNHGWGISCDFGSGVETAGTAAKRWMDANGPSYGWQPTGNGFSRPEPWHFDYSGTWTGPSNVNKNAKAEDVDTVIVRCTGPLSEYPVAGYTVLVGVRSLRHLSNIDMVNAMRVVGTPYYELDWVGFYNVLSSMGVPRSAIRADADYFWG
ncbi:M15 family metallopeptidase [Frigoribacterium sp. 2-23]|uniref:M15 family metallopeptidase n=1 Tax=Frigoribacterium sp. 2-23 TaxID=3415006 RepID=UPI003C70047F